MKPSQRQRYKKVAEHQNLIKDLLSNQAKFQQILEEIDDQLEIQQILERKVKKQKKLTKHEQNLLKIEQGWVGNSGETPKIKPIRSSENTKFAKKVFQDLGKTI